MLMLNWPESLDDHPRPKEPDTLPQRLWRRYHYPETLMCIWLWKDGRTQETTSTLYEDPSLSPWNGGADAVSRHGLTYDDDAWEVEVLRNAGYTLEAVS